MLWNIGIVQKVYKWHSQNRHLDTKLYLEAMLGIQLWPSTSKLHLEFEIGLFAAIKIWITQKVSDLSIEPSFVPTYLMMAIVFLVLLTSSIFTGRDTIFAKWIPDNLLWKVFPIFCGVIYTSYNHIKSRNNLFKFFTDGPNVYHTINNPLMPTPCSDRYGD